MNIYTTSSLFAIICLQFFARPWATPSRLSHEDQHKSSLDGEMESAGIPSRKASPTAEPKITLFDERVQSSKIHGEKAKIENEDESNLSLRDFIDVHGFSAKNRPSLKQILKAHTEQPNAHKTQNQGNTQNHQFHFIHSCRILCTNVARLSETILFCVFIQ